MDTGLWVALGGLAIAVLGAVVGVVRFLVQAPLQARSAGLQAEVDRLKGEVETHKERNRELTSQYEGVLRDFVNLKSGKGGVLLKHEVEAEMELTMKVLAATESSVLVPAPFLRPPGFVFLTVHGPAGPRLRTVAVPLDRGLVGRVFKTGILTNTADAYGEAEFFSAVDRKADHQTTSLLAVPLRSEGRVIGVAQFLSKVGGGPFDAEDERIALDRCRIIANRVSDFVGDPANFDVLRLDQGRETKEATIVFCDLSASSALYHRMDAPSAIRCIDEYLGRQTDIALKHGATIDKYLGDGVMLRFNVPLRILDDDHAARAVLSALEMRRDFERLKASWKDFGLSVESVFARVGLACGPVHEAAMGHPQFQHLTVVGETVNRAANLCEIAPRDRSLVVVDGAIHERLGAGQRSRKLALAPGAAPRGTAFEAYELVE